MPHRIASLKSARDLRLGLDTDTAPAPADGAIANQEQMRRHAHGFQLVGCPNKFFESLLVHQRPQIGNQFRISEADPIQRAAGSRSTDSALNSGTPLGSNRNFSAGTPRASSNSRTAAEFAMMQLVQRTNRRSITRSRPDRSGLMCRSDATIRVELAIFAASRPTVLASVFQV